MSAHRPGNMRGSWGMTHLLLLLLLLTSLTGTVCNAAEEEEEPEDPAEETNLETQEPDATTTDTPTSVSPSFQDSTLPPLETSSSETSPSPSAEEGSAENYGISASEEFSGDGPPSDENEGLNPTIILIPVALVVIIIGMVVGGIVINRRWNNKIRNPDRRKDSYLDDSTEKVPMPMFEEDVPSVLELEMEELDQWMSKDGGAAVDSEDT